MPTSPRLGFTYLVVGQNTPETAVNEISAILEAASGHFIFKDRDLADPSALTPSNGDCYLVAAGASGAWAGHSGHIAYYLNTDWVFIVVTDGYTAWVLDEGAFIVRSSGAWTTFAATAGSFVPLSYLATDTALAANSDSKIATQKAVKAYVDNAVTGLVDWKGATDCSANPNYPAASKGDAYTVSVAGKIGGASGASVDVGDVFIATADNAGGTQAAVGASWVILEHNLVSALAASFATAAEVRAGTVSNKVIAPDTLAAAIDPQALVDAPTTNWDMSQVINAEWTIGGNRTLAVSNPRKGMVYVLTVTQDATGSHVPTWPASFNWGAAGAPTPSTAAGKTDVVTLYCRDAATPKFRAVFNKDS